MELMKIQTYYTFRNERPILYLYELLCGEIYSDTMIIIRSALDSKFRIQKNSIVHQHIHSKYNELSDICVVVNSKGFVIKEIYKDPVNPLPIYIQENNDTELKEIYDIVEMTYKYSSITLFNKIRAVIININNKGRKRYVKLDIVLYESSYDNIVLIKDLPLDYYMDYNLIVNNLSLSVHKDLSIYRHYEDKNDIILREYYYNPCNYNGYLILFNWDIKKNKKRNLLEGALYHSIYGVLTNMTLVIDDTDSNPNKRTLEHIQQLSDEDKRYNYPYIVAEIDNKNFNNGRYVVIEKMKYDISDLFMKTKNKLSSATLYLPESVYGEKGLQLQGIIHTKDIDFLQYFNIRDYNNIEIDFRKIITLTN